MAKRKIIGDTHTLDDLLQSRYHGAGNIAGIRFQLLYSVLRVFDLYSDAPASEVRFEGLEDVDVQGVTEKALKGVQSGDTYIQVKRTGTPKTLSWLDSEKILDHFIEVYLKQPDAHFILLTSLPLKDSLQDFVRYCHGQRATLPPSVEQTIHTIAARSHLSLTDVPTFLRRISFEFMNEDQLLDRLQVALIRSFQLNAGNEYLYLSRLMDCATLWAANRKAVE